MKSYYRLMLGAGSIHANDCFSEEVVGTDFGLTEDLTDKLPEEWRDFNKGFIPILIQNEPGKSRVSAGLACAAIWTVSKGMKDGDILLSPDGQGRYRVGEIIGGYFYRPGEFLTHRRPVKWSPDYIDRSEMSQKLRRSMGSGTVCNISSYAEEIEGLIGGTAAPMLVTRDESIEDPIAFAMETHLEDFLIENWARTDLGRTFDIYEEEGELVGRQYQTDTGPMDILAISKDKRTLLVVELKKGRASDAVVGQLLRYMGYVKDELLEEDQMVKGIIIALTDDQRLRRAISLLQGTVDFYRYEVNFDLIKT